MLVRLREGKAAAVSDKADVRQCGLRLEEAVRGNAQARGYPGQLSCLLKQALGPPGSCTQDHLLPSEYVQTMRDNMLDRCPVSTYEQARARLGVALPCTSGAGLRRIMQLLQPHHMAKPPVLPAWADCRCGRRSRRTLGDPWSSCLHGLGRSPLPVPGERSGRPGEQA